MFLEGCPDPQNKQALGSKRLDRQVRATGIEKSGANALVGRIFDFPGAVSQRIEAAPTCFSRCEAVNEISCSLGVPDPLSEPPLRLNRAQARAGVRSNFRLYSRRSGKGCTCFVTGLERRAVHEGCNVTPGGSVAPYVGTVTG